MYTPPNSCSGVSKLIQEAVEGRVDLPDDDAEIVWFMLKFMYERDYRLPSEDVPGPHWARLLWNKPNNVLTLKVLRQSETRLWKHASPFLRDMIAEIPGLEEVRQFPTASNISRANSVQNVTGTIYNFNVHSFDNEAYAYLKDVCKYDQQRESWPVDALDLNLHAQVYAIADKYYVKGLKSTARAKFEQAMDKAYAGKAF